MPNKNAPYLLDPDTFEGLLANNEFLIIDLCSQENYQQGHILGAIHLDYSALIAGVPPAVGKLPSLEKLQSLFDGLGLTPSDHVAAYDDVGGTKAGRLLWTLDVIGHQKRSILNALGDEQIIILDARSEAEHNGLSSPSRRHGKIPGSANLNWQHTIDPDRNLRLKPDETLMAMLDDLGISKNKTIIAHCQTHHRSSQSYIMLKHLGFEKVKAYPGSWSEWGNDDRLPIA
jgi:thiosulfate/3-mercaptopyruvate sulfurtransferase